jgi:hypothetical protein
MFTWISNNIGGPAIVIFIGVVISAVGALWATMQQTASEQELRQKNEEIAKLNRKIADSITGGDSYCYFFIGRPGHKSNIVDLMLMSKGEYPLYDVSVKIDDVEKLLKLVREKQQSGDMPYDSITTTNVALSKASKVINVGNIGPSQFALMSGLVLPKDRDKQSYNIYITSRNGSIMQVVRFRKVNGKWKMAYKATRGKNILEEVIDSDFPRNDSGQVDW